MQVILEAEILCEKLNYNLEVKFDARFIAHNFRKAKQLLDLQQNSIKDGDENINKPFITVICCTQLCNADSYVKCGQILHKLVESNYQ